MNGGAHGKNGIQGHPVELGELGQQVHRIEGGAEDGHAHGAKHQADDRTVAVLVQVIPDGGGKHEGAAHHEIGKIPHKGGGGALEQQLQQNFHTLTDHRGAGSQVEAAQQHRQLGKVQLVKAGSQEGQREVQHVQHRGQGGADADDAYPSGGSHLPALRQEVLGKLGKQSKAYHQCQTGQNEGQIFGNLGQQRTHITLSNTKNRPGNTPRA